MEVRRPFLRPMAFPSRPESGIRFHTHPSGTELGDSKRVKCVKTILESNIVFKVEYDLCLKGHT